MTFLPADLVRHRTETVVPQEHSAMSVPGRVVRCDDPLRTSRTAPRSPPAARDNNQVPPLDEQGWAAVRAMVPRVQAQPAMDQLGQIGARAVLVTPLEVCRH